MAGVNIDVIAVHIWADRICAVDTDANLRLVGVGDEHLEWDRLEEEVLSPGMENILAVIEAVVDVVTVEGISSARDERALRHTSLMAEEVEDESKAICSSRELSRVSDFDLEGQMWNLGLEGSFNLPSLGRCYAEVFSKP